MLVLNSAGQLPPQDPSGFNNLYINSQKCPAKPNSYAFFFACFFKSLRLPAQTLYCHELLTGSVLIYVVSERISSMLRVNVTVSFSVQVSQGLILMRQQNGCAGSACQSTNIK